MGNGLNGPSGNLRERLWKEKGRCQDKNQQLSGKLQPGECEAQFWESKAQRCHRNSLSIYRRTYFRVNKVKFFVENMKRYNNWISIPKGLGIHHREANLYPSKDMKSFWFKKVQTALKRMATNGSHHPLEAEANPWHLSLGQEEGFFSDHLLWRGAASSLPYLMFFSKAVRALTTALKASSLPGAMHLSGWSSTASFR